MNPSLVRRTIRSPTASPSFPHVTAGAVSALLNNDCGMGLVCVMRLREIICEVVTVAIVLDNVTDLWCMVSDRKGAENSGCVDRIRNGSFYKLGMRRGQFELTRCSSGPLHMRRNENCRP